MEKLEIRYSLVKEDEDYEDGDWTECWFVNYQGICMVVDSAGRTVPLGAMDIDPEDLSNDWFTLEDHDVNIDHYGYFLHRLMEFVEPIAIDFGVEQHPAIHLFDLLWGHYSNFIDNPVELGRKLEVPLEYMDSFIESYSDLDVPWVTSY